MRGEGPIPRRFMVLLPKLITIIGQCIGGIKRAHPINVTVALETGLTLEVVDDQPWLMSPEEDKFLILRVNTVSVERKTIIWVFVCF